MFYFCSAHDEKKKNGTDKYINTLSMYKYTKYVYGWQHIATCIPSIQEEESKYVLLKFSYNKASKHLKLESLIVF